MKMTHRYTKGCRRCFPLVILVMVLVMNGCHPSNSPEPEPEPEPGREELVLKETIWQGVLTLASGESCNITITFLDEVSGKFGLHFVAGQDGTPFLPRYSYSKGTFSYVHTTKIIRLIDASNAILSTDWWIKSKKPGELLLFSNPTANSCQLHLKQVF